MADAYAAGVVEGHLDHELGAQLDPRELAPLRPARRLAAAALARLIRLERRDQLALLLGPEAARVADLAQVAGVVVEAEDQGAHGVLGLAGARAHDDGVDGAHALDLDHPGALAGAIR